MADCKRYILRFRIVNRDIWQAIKTGKKPVETRAASVRYSGIKEGDKIVFVCQGKKFEKTVKKVKKYMSISALLKDYKIRDINPNFKTIEELRKSYLSFPKYKEKIKKYGIIALEFK